MHWLQDGAGAGGLRREAGRGSGFAGDAATGIVENDEESQEVKPSALGVRKASQGGIGRWNGLVVSPEDDNTEARVRGAPVEVAEIKIQGNEDPLLARRDHTDLVIGHRSGATPDQRRHIEPERLAQEVAGLGAEIGIKQEPGHRVSAS